MMARFYSYVDKVFAFRADGQACRFPARTSDSHRGVVCHLIGQDPAIPLDVEMQRPGEGEAPAARRLLERVFANDSRYCDAVVGDGLYREAPFITTSTHWGLDRVFEHEPAAIVHFILTLFLAFTLVQCFRRRNLKPPLRDRFTPIGLAAELYLGPARPPRARSP